MGWKSCQYKASMNHKNVQIVSDMPHHISIKIVGQQGNA